MNERSAIKGDKTQAQQPLQVTDALFGSQALRNIAAVRTVRAGGVSVGQRVALLLVPDARRQMGVLRIVEEIGWVLIVGVVVIVQAMQKRMLDAAATAQIGLEHPGRAQHEAKVGRGGPQRARQELGVILHADKVRMIRQFDDFHALPVFTLT